MDRHPIDLDDAEEFLFLLKKALSDIKPSELDTFILLLQRTDRVLPTVSYFRPTTKTPIYLRRLADEIDDAILDQDYTDASLAGETAELEGIDDPDAYN